MDYDAINRVTSALKTLLDSELKSLSGADETVFVGPMDDPGTSGFRLLLYLYRIAANADLRSSEHIVPSPSSEQPATVYEGGLPLDLYYLITAGTSAPGGELTALTLLGRVMQALNDAPLLVGTAVRNETVRLTMDPISSEEMGRVWSLFPTANYRTSVVYVATPVWIDPARPSIAAPPVVEEPHFIGQVGS